LITYYNQRPSGFERFGLFTTPRGVLYIELALNILVQFLYLQVLDILTTLAFLMNGVKEANPLVRLALEAGPSPLIVLLLVKVVAAALAIYCVRRSRLRLLSRVNLFFAALIAWNLLMLIISSPSLGLVT